MNILTVKLRFTYLKRKLEMKWLLQKQWKSIYIIYTPSSDFKLMKTDILIQSRIQADTYTFCQNVFPIGFHTVKEEILYKYNIISIYSLKNFIFKNNVHFQDSNNHVIPK